MGEKKRCFIITPIGGENEPIRRHIEGIIDAAIVPVLNDEFEIVVAHRIHTTGTITKQIIAEIYSADLVIANLTGRNPNVMYELALRHCIGTPLITIADQETSLPADIISERTIFYKNDAQGVLDLRDELLKYVGKIDYSQKNSPILDALSDVIKTNSILELTQESGSEEDSALNLIIKKLNSIERGLEKGDTLSAPRPQRRYMQKFWFDEAPEGVSGELVWEELKKGLIYEPIELMSMDFGLEEKVIAVTYLAYDRPSSRLRPRDLFTSILNEMGFVGVSTAPSRKELD